MTKTLSCLLLITGIALALDGPDFMLYGDLYIPDQNAFTLAPLENGRESGNAESTSGRNVSAILRYSSLYGVNSLRSTFAGARVATKPGTLCATFRDYGIPGLYTSTNLTFSFRRTVWKRLGAAIGYSRTDQRFGDRIVELSSDALLFSAAWQGTGFAISGTLTDMLLEKSEYEERAELLAALSWNADEIISVHAIYHRDSQKQNRFMAGQTLQLFEAFNFKAGLITGPEIYFAGFELVYKRFAFDYTFFETGGLPDCSRFGLSYR